VKHPKDYCHEEVSVVFGTDTVVEPLAVMIEALGATITLGTMLTLDQSPRAAKGAEMYQTS
jgi:hypothetical protein